MGRIRVQEATQESEIQVYIVRSRHVGWRGLTSMIQAEPNMRLVGEATHVDQAVPGVRVTHPDAVLVAPDAEGVSIGTLACALRDTAQASKIVIIGDRGDRETLIELARIPVQGWMTWAEVDESFVHYGFRALLGRQICMASQDVVDELVGSEEKVYPNYGIGLLDSERAVLAAVVSEGLNENEVPRATNMSRASVQRVIHALKIKLEARNLQ